MSIFLQKLPKARAVLVKPLLVMNRLSVRRHGRLLERFRERRVSVACSSDVLAAGAVLESQRAFGNHLAGVRADDVDAQYPIRLGIGDKLDHALGVKVSLRAAVGGERECADFVLDAWIEYALV